MRNPPPRCQSRVADGARLTDRPQGPGRPFGLRTPPAVELAASPMPNAGQKKSAGIEDGRWCALWFQAVKPGCGICRSGLMVRLDTSGCQSDFSAIDPSGHQSDSDCGTSAISRLVDTLPSFGRDMKALWALTSIDNPNNNAIYIISQNEWPWVTDAMRALAEN